MPAIRTAYGRNQGSTNGRNRLCKHRIPLLALPAAGTRSLPAPTQLRNGWRALSQSPFVVDVLKTPIIAVASSGCCNHHSGLRTTIRWEGASEASATIDTHLGFSVTNPLNTLFTMTRFVSQIDLVLAMYELCGWFSVFEPASAAEMQLKMAVEENRNSSTQDLFELGEGEDEIPWKRVYARTTVKVPVNEG